MDGNVSNELDSILEIHKIYLKRWLKLLCSTEELHKLFIDRFFDTEDIEESIYIFYEYLRSCRKHCVTVEQIKDCISEGDEMKLHELLEQLLLLPINYTEIIKFKKVIESGMTIQEFLEICENYGGLRLSKILDEYLLAT